MEEEILIKKLFRGFIKILGFTIRLILFKIASSCPFNT